MVRSRLPKEARSLLKYVAGAFAISAPSAVAIAAVRNAPLWMGVAVAAMVSCASVLPWLGLFICREYGGDLGRKLTRPLGGGGESADLDQSRASSVVVHQPRD